MGNRLNMSTASNITYKGLPCWEIPGAWEKFTRYNVPQLHMDFMLSDSGTYRAEFWHSTIETASGSGWNGTTGKVYRRGEDSQDLVWEESYGPHHYGAKAYEVAEDAVTRDLFPELEEFAERL